MARIPVWILLSVAPRYSGKYYRSCCGISFRSSSGKCSQLFFQKCIQKFLLNFFPMFVRKFIQQFLWKLFQNFLSNYLWSCCSNILWSSPNFFRKYNTECILESLLDLFFQVSRIIHLKIFRSSYPSIIYLVIHPSNYLEIPLG